MLTSDLTLNVSKFRPEAISEETNVVNEKLIQVSKAVPKWWEIGAEKHRQMRENGELPLPKPVLLESASTIAVPSRHSGRDISCRVFKPSAGTPKGVFYHIHGGGWVLQTEAYQDAMLQYLADQTALTFVSVGYRLAPENPYPAANEDCFDVANWLIANSHKAFGAPLLCLGGDSAGAHLSVLTCFHLQKSQPDFAFSALVLNFGAYNISEFLPQAHHFDLPLMLTYEGMVKYTEAYLPNTTAEQRRDPMISPLSANLNKMKLPPALFACGTFDPLLDDSILMSAKWSISGAESILKVYPGAPHGFVLLPPTGGSETVQQAWDDIATFVKERT